MPAMPPPHVATLRAQLPVSQRGATGAKMPPVAGEDATCRNAPRVTNAKPLATRRVCHRVGSRGKAPCLLALFYVHPCQLFSLPACRARGSQGPSGVVWSTYRHSHVEWLNPRVANPRLLLWSGFATLASGGWGVSPLGAELRGGGVWCVPAECGGRAAKPLHTSNRGVVTPG